MSIPSDRRSRLARRAKLVDKELSTVDASIRSLSRKLDRRSDELLDREDGHYEEEPVGVARIVQELASPDVLPSDDSDGSLRPSLDDDLRHVGVDDAVQPDADNPVPYYRRVTDDPSVVAKTVASVARSSVGEVLDRSVPSGADKELTSYFVGGGLKHAGPLRQERRIQRNKAIFLIIFFFLILFIVCFSIWR
jgi:hypothetical protein